MTTTDRPVREPGEGAWALGSAAATAIAASGSPNPAPASGVGVRRTTSGPREGHTDPSPVGGLGAGAGLDRSVRVAIEALRMAQAVLLEADTRSDEWAAEMTAEAARCAGYALDYLDTLLPD